jgi:hypothetical protein
VPLDEGLGGPGVGDFKYSQGLHPSRR